MNVSSSTDPEVRKQKTLALLYVGGGLILVLLIVWMVDTSAFNTEVEDSQCQLDGIAKDGCAEYKLSLEYEQKVKDRKRSYALPVVLLLLLVGLVIGMLFLPGYPFSKYLSYEECMTLSKLYPSDNWNWSSSQDQKTDLLCKWLGACKCRSYVQEFNCGMYALDPNVINQKLNVTYNYDLVQKKNSGKNLCLNRCGCCVSGGVNNSSGCNAIVIVNNGQYEIQACTGSSASGSCGGN